MALIDSGDVDGLRALLTAEPALLTARGYLDTATDGGAWYQGSTLLHAAANNPLRVVRRLPRLLETTDRLLELGADPDACTAGALTRGTDWTPDSLRTDQHVLALVLTYAACWGHVETMAWLVARRCGQRAPVRLLLARLRRPRRGASAVKGD